jgi:hypothetical protein
MYMKESSIVVMPVAERPEFAALALECLSKAEFCPPIHIYVDDVSQKLKDEFSYVFANHAPPQASIFFREPHVQATSGCHNILMSIKDGRESGAMYIYLVEEDVLVRPNFFKYHQDALSDGSVASCGRKYMPFWDRCPGMYTNSGSVLKGELVDAIIPHINPDFFANTGGYMEEVIGHVEGIHGLDDGLIRRVMWKNGWAAKHQEEPGCSHVGFMAYENRYDFCRVDHTAHISDRIANLRNLFLTLDPINGPHARYIKDLEPLSAEQIASLKDRT